MWSQLKSTHERQYPDQDIYSGQSLEGLYNLFTEKPIFIDHKQVINEVDIMLFRFAL